MSQLLSLVKMMKVLLLLALLLSTACTAGNLKTESSGESAEFHVLLSDLLNINQDKYTYIDASGQRQIDSLRMFKGVERIYIDYIEPDQKNGGFSHEQLKVIMFFSFYAEQKNSAALLEYLAADLMPVYQADPVAFLKALNESPFLIAANCRRLNAYFGFEGKNAGKKPGFVDNARRLMEQYLAVKNRKMCIEQF